MNIISLLFASVAQKGFIEQLQIWIMDSWHWIYTSAINPAMAAGSGLVLGLFGSGAFLGVITIYNILNED